MKQTDRHTNIYIAILTDRQIDMQEERQADTQAAMQADRKIER
jgi:hypothetical protein